MKIALYIFGALGLAGLGYWLYMRFGSPLQTVNTPTATVITTVPKANLIITPAKLVPSIHATAMIAPIQLHFTDPMIHAPAPPPLTAAQLYAALPPTAQNWLNNKPTIVASNANYYQVAIGVGNKPSKALDTMMSQINAYIQQKNKEVTKTLNANSFLLDVAGKAAWDSHGGQIGGKAYPAGYWITMSMWYRQYAKGIVELAAAAQKGLCAMYGNEIILESGQGS
jgi:hypothetical protein